MKKEAMPLTLELKSIVFSVAGTKAHKVFNDKRANNRRSYKFAGIVNLTNDQVDKISDQIKAKYPQNDFKIQNAVGDYHGGGCACCNGYYDGLVINIAEI